jgi:hypothetical protein
VNDLGPALHFTAGTTIPNPSPGIKAADELLIMIGTSVVVEQYGFGHEWTSVIKQIRRPLTIGFW